LKFTDKDLESDCGVGFPLSIEIDLEVLEHFDEVIDTDILTIGTLDSFPVTLDIDSADHWLFLGFGKRKGIHEVSK
jgi:hypothetical protein